MMQHDGLDELAILGELLMAASLMVIVYTVRKAWSSSLGFLFALSLFLYHGICEFCLLLFPIGLSYRIQGAMDVQHTGETVLTAGIGLFAFAIAYSLGRPRPLIGGDEFLPAQPYEWLFQVKPVVLIPWVLCGAIYRAGGENLIEESGAVGYVLSALLYYVNIPLMILAILMFSVQHTVGKISTRRYVMCLLGMVFAFSVVGGNRQETFVAALASFILLHKFRIKQISVTRLVAPAAVLVCAFLALACIRAAIGRDDLMSASPSERFHLVVDGFKDAFTIDRWQETVDVVTTDLGYRFDGNLFLCNTMVAGSSDPFQAWDLEPLRLSTMHVVPSFLWPGKNDRSYRSFEQYMIYVRNLPDIDYLQTPLAEFYACGGMGFMILAMLASGIVLARLENLVAVGIERAMVHPSQPALILGISTVCLAVGLTFVESGLVLWLLSIRNVVILWSILRVSATILRR